MSNENELLAPCPFCGSPAKMLRDGGDENGERFWPICSNRNCILPVKWYSRAEAIAAWNRRAEPSPPSPVPVEAVRPTIGGLAAGWEIITVYRDAGYGCSWVTDLAGLTTEIDRLLATDGALIWSVTPVGLLRAALPAAPAHREVGE